MSLLSPSLNIGLTIACLRALGNIPLFIPFFMIWTTVLPILCMLFLKTLTIIWFEPGDLLFSNDLTTFYSSSYIGRWNWKFTIFQRGCNWFYYFLSQHFFYWMVVFVKTVSYSIRFFNVLVLYLIFR